MSDETQETRATTPDPPEQGSEASGATLRRRIGQYEIRCVLASGGMGVVYEAWQSSPRRPVALKLMKSGLSSASARERFEREAQVLARLHHPGIVQIYELGAHQENAEATPYIAMEFISGAQTLAQYVSRHTLRPRQIVELLTQACNAVQHGNEKGIIHRDLKPSNILVDQDGRVKVIDFGIARALDSDDAALTLQTSMGQLVGTIQYMSPEQVAGDSRSLDARTDVYSLGIVLYELLAGQLPFDLRGKSLAEGSRIVQQEVPLSLERVKPGIDRNLATIVMKAMSKRRADRYASVRDLCEDLSRWLKGEPVTARREGSMATAAKRLSRWAQRSSFAACLGILGLSTLIAWFSTQQIAFRLPSFEPLRARMQIGSPEQIIAHFDQVRVITINKSDGSKTAEVDAAAAKVEGVNNNDPRSWRLLHAALMKKLAVSGARTVAFDIHFPESDPRSDSAMFAGIESLATAEIPLVLFRKVWPDSNSLIDPRHKILSDPRVVIGVGVLANDGNIVLANRRDENDPWPSLALAAWSGKELGRLPTQYAFNPVDNTIEATSRAPGAASLGHVIRKISLPATVIQAVKEDHSDTNSRKGDIEALLKLGSPTAEALTQATTQMGDVLTMSDSKLREIFGGKIVVVADAAGDTVVQFRNGVQSRGFAAHMVGIEMLSRNRVPHVADTTESVAVVLVAGLIGVLIGLGTRTLCARWGIWLVAAIAILVSLVSVIGLCYISPMALSVIVHPLTPCMAAVIAAAISGMLVHIHQGNVV